MKRTTVSIVVVMFGMLTAWVSCATKKMPEAQLVGVRYTHSGTMAGYVFEGEMRTEKNGDVVLQAMKAELPDRLLQGSRDRADCKHGTQLR